MAGKRSRKKADKAVDATRAANVAERRKAIAKAVKELYAIHRDVERIREKEIKPLNEAARDIRQRMRDEFQVPSKALNVRLAAFKIEKEGDDDTAYALAETFESLPIGTQLDIFKQPASAVPKATAGANGDGSRPETTH